MISSDVASIYLLLGISISIDSRALASIGFFGRSVIYL
ncbi:unnamed protein product [Acidithrix sp. C25]|nr:unnamed protein product [Acidithrix sp. C25]